MKTTQATMLPSCTRAFKVSALAAATSIAVSSPAMAFTFEKGEVSGSWDTTLSYGLGVRVEDRDPSIIGFINGGQAASVNYDDGNLNFDKGDVFSNAIKLSSDIELNYKNYGAFFRVNALYDQVLANNEFADRPNANAPGVTGVRDLSDDANDLAGQRIELFDAFVYADVDVADRPATFKIGNQLLSWGESTFIQNSINTINPVDVSKLRVPGSELKEALLPVPIVSGAIDLTDNTSLEAFYQLAWEPVRIDPTGTFFGAADFAGEGGFEHGVFFGFGRESDSGLAGGSPAESDLPLALGRGADREARDDGQFGLAYRVFVPALNDTEFGFYFINYHSRLPIISARAPTAAAVQNAVQQGEATLAAASANPATASQASTAATAAYINALTTGVNGQGAAQYFLDYPEDIQLYGVSFNSSLGTTGIALQGELSHRVDVPLQVDDVELLYAGLGAAASACTGSVVLCNGVTQNLANNGQLGPRPVGEIIPGFILRDVTQLQSTATKAFGNVLGANRLIVLGEVGFNYVHDLPEKDELRLDAAGTFISANRQVVDTSGNPLLHAADGFADNDEFADDFSWGYRIAGRLEYLNALGAVNLLPRFSWSQDVEGISPGPGGSFIEGRQAYTLGVDFDYQNEWSGGIAYTNFAGAGPQNLLRDRDFVSLNVKYSF